SAGAQSFLSPNAPSAYVPPQCCAAPRPLHSFPTRRSSDLRNYLKKHANVFVEVEKGIPIGKRRLMPTSGLRMKKKLTYDTNENRYIKWTMERLIYKLKDLLKTVQKQNNRFKKNMDTVLVEKIRSE